MIAFWILLCSLSTSAENLEQEFWGANEAYQAAYERFLFLEKEGPSLLAEQKEKWDAAASVLRNEQSVLQGIEQEREAAVAEGRQIPGKISQTKREIKRLKKELKKVKKRGVRQGLFSNEEAISRDSVRSRIQEIDSSRDEWVAKINAVEEQVQSLLESDEYRRLFKNIDDGKQELSQIEAEFSTLLDDLSDLQRALGDLQQDETELGAEEKRLAGLLDDAINKDLAQLLKRYETLQSRYRRLQSRRNSLEWEKDSLEVGIRQAVRDTRDTENERDRARRAVRSLESELAQIRRDVQAIPRHESRLVDVRNDLIPQYRRRVAELEPIESELRREYEGKESIASEAASVLERRTRDRDSAQSEYNNRVAQRDQVASRVQELEESVARIPRMEQRLQNLAQKIRNKENLISDLNSRIPNVASRISGLEQRMRQQQSRLSEIQGRVSEVQTRMSNLQAKKAEFQAKLAEATAANNENAIARFQARIAEIDGKIQNVSSRLQTMNGNLERIRANFDEANGKYQQAKERLSNMRSRVENARSDIAQFNNRIQRVRSRLSQARQDQNRLSSERSQLRSAESRVRNAESSLSSAQSSMDWAQRDYNDKQAIADEARSRWEPVWSDLSSNQSTLENLINEESWLVHRIAELKEMIIRGDNIESTYLPSERRALQTAIDRLEELASSLRRMRSRLVVVDRELPKAVRLARQAEIDFLFVEKEKTFIEGKIEKMKATLASHRQRQQELAGHLALAQQLVDEKRAEIKKNEERTEKLAEEIKQAELALRSFQAEKVEPLNTRISELSGELASHERQARKYREFFDLLKSAENAQSVAESELADLVELQRSMDEVLASFQPRLDSQQQAINVANEKVEAEKLVFEEIKKEMSSQASLLSTAEELNYQALENLLNGEGA